MFNNKPRMKKIIGLRNIVTTKDKWSYLLFYDMDNPSEGDIRGIIEYLESWRISYIIYETKHGIHVVGLSPMCSADWGLMFEFFQEQFPEYYSGQTIRLSLKEGEKQSLVFYNLNYPVLYNLYKIYSKRFPRLEEYYMHKLADTMDDFCIDNTHHLVFEKYWSRKT